MEGPATYRINVKGHLVSDWSDRLSDMKVERSVGPGRSGDNRPRRAPRGSGGPVRGAQYTL